MEQKVQNELKENTGNEQKVYAHLRNRRQAEGVDSMEGYDGVPEMPQDKPGFFDRAAKVVMELLQRFLKWINTQDD